MLSQDQKSRTQQHFPPKSRSLVQNQAVKSATVSHGFTATAAEGTFSFPSNLRSERPQNQKLQDLLKVAYDLKAQASLQLDPIGQSKILVSLDSLGRHRLHLLRHCSAS